MTTATTPLRLIAAVHIETLPLLNRRYAFLMLDCGCTRIVGLPEGMQTPKVGEPARCWGRHQL